VWPEAYVVYMQGIPTPAKIDPEGNRSGWQREPGQLGNRDLEFFDAVLATMRSRFPIDSRRIYATGFSNGAFFTYLLWAEAPRVFAAFAPCAGLVLPTTHLVEPRPVMIITGREDPLVHFDEAEKTIETARTVDGALGAGEACGPNCTRYASSK